MILNYMTIKLWSVLKELNGTQTGFLSSTVRFLWASSFQNFYNPFINNLRQTPFISIKVCCVIKLNDNRIDVFVVLGNTLVSGNQTRMFILVNRGIDFLLTFIQH